MKRSARRRYERLRRRWWRLPSAVPVQTRHAYFVSTSSRRRWLGQPMRRPGRWD